MTVQEVIDELLKVEDKSKVINLIDKKNNKTAIFPDLKKIDYKTSEIIVYLESDH